MCNTTQALERWEGREKASGSVTGSSQGARVVAGARFRGAQAGKRPALSPGFAWKS